MKLLLTLEVALRKLKLSKALIYIASGALVLGLSLVPVTKASASAYENYAVLSGTANGTPYSGSFVNINYNPRAYEFVGISGGVERWKHTYTVDLYMNLFGAGNTFDGYVDLNFEFLASSNAFGYNVKSITNIEGASAFVYGQQSIEPNGHCQFRLVTYYDDFTIYEANRQPIAQLEIEFYSSSSSFAITAFGGYGSFNFSSSADLSSIIVERLNSVLAELQTGNANLDEISLQIASVYDYLIFINSKLANVEQYSSQNVQQNITLHNDLTSVFNKLEAIRLKLVDISSDTNNIAYTKLVQIINLLTEIRDQGASSGQQIDDSASNLADNDTALDNLQNGALGSVNVSEGDFQQLSTDSFSVISAYSQGLNFWEKLVQGFTVNASAIFSVVVVGLLLGLFNFILRRK